MTSALRRKILYRMKDWDEVVYKAVIGSFSKDENDFSDGTLPDISYKVVFGETPTLAADTETQIWTNPSGSMETPAAAETLSIASSSIEDDAGGTGIDAIA